MNSEITTHFVLFLLSVVYLLEKKNETLTGQLKKYTFCYQIISKQV